MKKIIITILLTVVLQIVAIGCSCIGNKEIKEEISETNVIFQGYVLSKEVIVTDTIAENFLLKKVRYTFRIDKVLKGIKRMEADFIIETGIGNGDCGFIFDIGDTYIVYANKEKSKEDKRTYYETSICERTTNDCELEVALIMDNSKRCLQKRWGRQ